MRCREMTYLMDSGTCAKIFEKPLGLNCTETSMALGWISESFFFQGGPLVVKFHFTNSKLSEKHFSTKKVREKYQISISRETKVPQHPFRCLCKRVKLFTHSTTHARPAIN